MRIAVAERQVDNAPWNPRRRVRVWPFIVGTGVLLTAYWSLALTVLGTDPYDLYPWGASVTTGMHYAFDDSNRAVAIAARDRAADMVIIGASTAMMYTPAMMRTTFPDAHHPWNVSYSGAAPLDRHLVLQTFIRHSHVSRILTWLDWMYQLPPTSVTPDFPTFMYDDDVLNDLRSVGPESALAAWRLLSTGTPFQDERLAERDYSARTIRTFERFQTAGAMRSVAKMVDEYRARVDEPRLSTCDGFPALLSLLVPDLHALSARGIRVDVVIPPYSLAMYYRFAADAAAGAARGGTLRLRDQLLMRRCLVEQVSRIPNVRVVALDLDLAMVSDLANYRDEGHLYGRALTLTTLRRIDDPAFQLTPGNVSQYSDRLRAAVANYHVTNSRLNMEHNRGS